MTDNLKLMCIMAHPDDESLGLGGILAKYADAGVETSLLTATRGEKGWNGPMNEYPGPEELGQIRTKELNEAAAILGIGEVIFLDYMDGELDKVEPVEVIDKIVTHLRRLRPQIVVTFDPYGVYGHPDHIAISQLTTAAVVAATDAGYRPETGAPHRVSKLYYMVTTRDEIKSYREAFGDLVMEIDGVERREVPWEDWSVTTIVETREYWPQVWQAVSCHQSQIAIYDELSQLPAEDQADLWSRTYFYRAFSLVNGGREIENDLFTGIRENSQTSLNGQNK